MFGDERERIAERNAPDRSCDRYVYESADAGDTLVGRLAKGGDAACRDHDPVGCASGDGRVTLVNDGP